MRNMFLDALSVAPTRAAPPRMPPPPPPRPVKLGGNGNGDKPEAPKPAPHPAPDPLDIPDELKRKPRFESLADQTATRPSYADDIDRIVADLVASGAIVFDKETDSYRAPHYRAYRFEVDNARA